MHDEVGNDISFGELQLVEELGIISLDPDANEILTALGRLALLTSNRAHESRTSQQRPQPVIE